MKTDKTIMIFTVLLSALAFFGSCTSQESKSENIFLNEVINKMKPAESVRYIVILPGLGCNGCIEEGEAFLKEHVENKDVFFVLTKISSLKILEQKIGLRINEHPNILIDRDNEFTIPSDNNIYPCIVHLKNRKIVSYEFQSPKNGNAFVKLNKII